MGSQNALPQVAGPYSLPCCWLVSWISHCCCEIVAGKPRSCFFQMVLMGMPCIFPARQWKILQYRSVFPLSVQWILGLPSPVSCALFLELVWEIGRSCHTNGHLSSVHILRQKRPLRHGWTFWCWKNLVLPGSGWCLFHLRRPSSLLTFP